MERSTPEEVWRVITLTNDEILRIPEVDIEIPVSEFYEAIEFEDTEPGEPAG